MYIQFLVPGLLSGDSPSNPMQNRYLYVSQQRDLVEKTEKKRKTNYEPNILHPGKR